MIIKPLCKLFQTLLKRLRGLGRDHQQRGLTIHNHPTIGCGCLNHHMRIRPRNPKTRNPSTTQHTTNITPLTTPINNLQTQLIPRNKRIQLPHIQRRHQHPKPHLQQHRNQRHQTRRSLRMPQTRLHRRQRNRHTTTKHHTQRINLNRIPQPSPRPMRHHMRHRTRIHTPNTINTRQQINLSRTRRRSNPISPTIIIHTRRNNRPITTTRNTTTLQHHNRHSLTRNHPISRSTKRRTTTRPRQHPRISHRIKRTRMSNHMRPSNHRHITLTSTQRQPRLMQRNQTRRTRRINRQNRTTQIQKITQPRRQHTRMIGRDWCIRFQPGEVSAVLGTDIHADAFVGQIGRAESGVLQRMPHLLQQQPLPRIHQFRFSGGDVEEPGVELVDPVQRPHHPTPTITPTRPQPRHIPHNRLTTTQHRPQPQHITSTREPTSHPHHINRLINTNTTNKPAT